MRGIVDLDTGVILSEFDDECRVITKKQADTCKQVCSNRAKGIAKWRENSIAWGFESFSMTNNDELKMVMNDVTQAEWAVLTKLMCYVEYSSMGIIVGNNAILSTEDVAKIVGLSEKTTKTALVGLDRKLLLVRCKRFSNGFQYLMNPWLCLKGSRINKTLKHVFREYRIRTKDNKKWKEL